MEDKLKRKIKGLQQQLRRTKARKQTMGNIIEELKQKLLLSQEDAELLSAKFDGSNLLSSETQKIIVAVILVEGDTEMLSRNLQQHYIFTLPRHMNTYDP